MSPNEFVRQLSPYAIISKKKYGIPSSFIIAQGALESGWGTSKLAAQGFNLFGIKADVSWKGETLSMRTKEFEKGAEVVIPAKWRKYEDWGGCIEDHAKFLQNNRRYRIAMALCGDVTAFTKAIQTAGYATDPHYADKILSIIQTHNLTRFDA